MSSQGRQINCIQLFIECRSCMILHFLKNIYQKPGSGLHSRPADIKRLMCQPEIQQSN